MTQSTSAISFATAYALYFGALGISAPYLNVYLQDQGLSIATIGTVTALIIVVRIFGQFGWSWLADSTGQPLLNPTRTST